MKLLSNLKVAVANPMRATSLLKNKLDRQIHQPTNNLALNAKSIEWTEDFIQQYVATNTVTALKKHINNTIADLAKYPYPSRQRPYSNEYNIDHNSAILLYALCRIIKPQYVVETGVAYGISSAYILQALADNNKGSLTSIDSTFRTWQSIEMIGYAIPETLRQRWNLVVGTSQDKLQSVLRSLGQIDIFVHDSLHTYNNMKWEYHTAWQYLKRYGLLVTDDANSNDAFYEHCKSWQLQPLIVKQQKAEYLGIVRKL